ncbi:tRNA(Met) cytidine acetyltransferase TmcA [Parendozoicomonas haliclonae]|uniref:tRNA(Met) cytidine acetyltransferase TmcA n=1 Tax=Parendozoicomonas haliclonae TaxID=1960125 RepID=A0A1X7AKQ4_9GAMM|nr:GNAT family N-acetyltransferase [Parendozoicomonas haliclonae]SMA47443.1 tRNA(Met) cytidine acetyltransferase TmcA [Parendozoicomonas haliclonae]
MCPQPTSSFSETLHAHLQAAGQYNHRLPLILTGDQEWLSQQLAALSATTFPNGEPLAGTLFSNRTDWSLSDSITCRGWNKANQYLGQTVSTLYLDLTEDIPADNLGIVSGTVKGGGLLVLLCPHKGQWVGDSGFLKRSQRILFNSHSALHWDQQTGLVQQPDIVEVKPYTIESTQPYASREQQQAVEAIKRVKTGHRRRPLVLTADRGRGKSAALGIAAAQLMMQESGLRIVVTGPSLKTTDTLFVHAASGLEALKVRKGHIVANNSELTFIAPDELARNPVEASLVLVDEAAALPAPLLSRLLKQYSRIVFASTIHGYEGTGRGFAIRFHKTLDRVTPKWQRCQITTPVRWAEHDPTEQLINQLLLLNADIPSFSDFTGSQQSEVSTENLIFQEISRHSLLDHEDLLGQITGLLINAHYQTRPEDIRYLLDRDDLRLFTLKQGEQLLATALISIEGGFEAELAQEIWSGRRRPKGHLLPQTLCTHAGFQQAATLTMARIMRIAVHPERQQQGLGKLMVSRIKESLQNNNLDMLGSCFGTTAELVQFWRQCGLMPAHIGSTRNAASGCYNLTVITPLSPASKELAEQVCARFVMALPYQAPLSLQQMEAEILIALSDQAEKPIAENHSERLLALAHRSQSIDSCLPELHSLMIEHLGARHKYLNTQQQILLVSRFLQHKSWPEAIQESGLSGRREAEDTVVKAVALLLQITD